MWWKINRIETRVSFGPMYDYDVCVSIQCMKLGHNPMHDYDMCVSM